MLNLLTYNFTNRIKKKVIFNQNIIFEIKIIKNKRYNKQLLLLIQS